MLVMGISLQICHTLLLGIVELIYFLAASFQTPRESIDLSTRLWNEIHAVDMLVAHQHRRTLRNQVTETPARNGPNHKFSCEIFFLDSESFSKKECVGVN